MSKFINVDEFLSSIPDDIEPDETEWCPICKMMSKEDVEDIVIVLMRLTLVRLSTLFTAVNVNIAKLLAVIKKYLIWFV